MSLKIFIHYDDQGNILSQTFEDEIFFNKRVLSGEKIIEVEQQLDFKNYKIDMSTMKIVEKEDRT